MKIAGIAVAALLLTTACSSGAEPEPDPAAESAPCDGNADVTAASGDMTAHSIVYVSDRDGSWDLWLTKEDGSDAQPLTRDDAVEWTPSWSPDGGRLAFACARSQDGQSDLFVMDADGTDRERLTDSPDSCEASPTWSPAGDRLFYASGTCDGPQGIWTMAADGGSQRQVVEEAGWPALSPDGERLVYDRPRSADSFLDASLWMSSDSGEGATEVGPASVPAAYEASWSPDGTQVAFVVPSGDPSAEDPVKWNEDLYVMDADGTSVRRVTRTPGNDHWPAAWSPDGTRLAYSADGLENATATLTVIDIRTGVTTALTEPGTNALFPTWR